MADSTDRRWNAWLFLALSGVWGLTFVYESTPLNDTTWCLWRRLTELNCAGCGLTRSFTAMSSGAVLLAGQQHPAGPLLYLGMVVAWAQSGARLRRGHGRALKLPDRLVHIYWGSVVIVFTFNLVRTLFVWSGLTS